MAANADIWAKTNWRKRALPSIKSRYPRRVAHGPPDRLGFGRQVFGFVTSRRTRYRSVMEKIFKQKMKPIKRASAIIDDNWDDDKDTYCNDGVFAVASKLVKNGARREKQKRIADWFILEQYEYFWEWYNNGLPRWLMYRMRFNRGGGLGKQKKRYQARTTTRYASAIRTHEVPRIRIQGFLRLNTRR